MAHGEGLLEETKEAELNGFLMVFSLGRCVLSLDLKMYLRVGNDCCLFGLRIFFSSGAGARGRERKGTGVWEG